MKRFEKVLLVITLLSELLAYGSALFMRYVVLNPLYSNPTRIPQFYKMLVIVVLLVRFLLFAYFNRNQADEPFWRQEPMDLFVTAVRQHGLLLICLTLYLFFIGSELQVSRTVMGFLILFGILYDVLSRVLVGKRIRQGKDAGGKETKVLLVYEGEEKDTLEANLLRYGYRIPAKGIHLDITAIHPIPVGSVSDYLPLYVSSGDYIYLSSKAKKRISEGDCYMIQESGLPLIQELSYHDHPLPEGRVVSCGGSAAVLDTFLKETCDVLGVKFTASECYETVHYVLTHTEELKGQYICFSNVHTTVMAHDEEDYRTSLNGAALVMPDGKPIAARIRQSGYPEAERVAGPDFMDAVFRLSAEYGVSHYFYGASQETIEQLGLRLKERYPGISIAGMVSPPFRELTDEEDEEAVQAINDSGASLIWIGLGAPKQEKWMASHQGRVNGVMLGVGAGFDFHAGTIKRAPKVLQKLGLEWLYRLFQDPKRLFKRYLVTNTKFLLYTRGKPEQK